MNMKISDLVDCIDDSDILLDLQTSVNSERVRKLVHQCISNKTDMKRDCRTPLRRFGIIAACAALVIVISTTALAAAGVIDFGAFYDSFFRNPKVTGAVTPNVSDKSAGIEIALTNAYTDGLTTHIVLQVTGLTDTEFDRIQFQTDQTPGYTIFGDAGQNYTITDRVLTIPATIYLSGTEAEKTGHVALVITGIALDTLTDNEEVISGNWDLTFDIKLPDADKTNICFTTKVENSDFIDEVTFDIHPATFEVIFTAKDGNQDLDAFAEYFRSIPKPVLTLVDGTTVKFENSGNDMIDSTMGSWWVNTEYFDITELKSITFCGQTYDIVQN